MPPPPPQVSLCPPPDPPPPQGLCGGFNVEVERARVFRGPVEGQFGYRVLQRASGGRAW